jgi:hypothetical protein
VLFSRGVIIIFFTGRQRFVILSFIGTNLTGFSQVWGKKLDSSKGNIPMEKPN